MLKLKAFNTTLLSLITFLNEKAQSFTLWALKQHLQLAQF
jgi:hypothetical protein